MAVKLSTTQLAILRTAVDQGEASIFNGGNHRAAYVLVRLGLVTMKHYPHDHVLPTESGRAYIADARVSWD